MIGRQTRRLLLVAFPPLFHSYRYVTGKHDVRGFRITERHRKVEGVHVVVCTATHNFHQKLEFSMFYHNWSVVLYQRHFTHALWIRLEVFLGVKVILARETLSYRFALHI